MVSAGGQSVDVYARPQQTVPVRGYHALHYRLKLTVDLERRTLDGEAVVTVSPLVDDFRECVLDAETFTVTAVTDDRGTPLRFERTPGRLAVSLARAYRRGDDATFAVRYRIIDPVIDPTRYGMVATYPIGLDFRRAEGHRPALFTAVSFPTGARHWFPCNDHPSDKATSEIEVTVATGLSALANGRLDSVTEHPASQTRTFRWIQDQPHSTYLFMVAVGPYEVVRDRLGDLPIGYWVYRDDVSSARRTFGRTPGILHFLGERFGVPFPWSKYDQVTVPAIGGGAECTSATLIGDVQVHDEKADKDFPTDWLVVHEAAHQWWGDLVTLRDWGEAWIHESFASYSEYLYLQYVQGDDEAALHLQDMRETYFREAATRYARPIVFDRWQVPNDNFDRHTYQKGAAVLHMLRFVIGDEAFFGGMRRFLREHAFSPVDTRQLQQAFEAESGQDLGWFFDEWLYKPGHPVLEVASSWDAQAKRIRLRVHQAQNTSTRVPIFKMPVLVAITTSEGTRIEKIWLRGATDEFEWPMSTKPLLVRFDQGNHLLAERRIATDEDELLYQLQHDDALGRVWAAGELARREPDDWAHAALGRASALDPSWAVRRAAVQAIGSWKRPEDAPRLVEAAVDINSKVRSAAVSALGRFPGSTLVAFFKQRFEADESYVAQAEALRALGTAGGADDLPFLRQAQAMVSPRDIIKAAAEQAIRAIEKRQ